MTSQVLRILGNMNTLDLIVGSAFIIAVIDWYKNGSKKNVACHRGKWTRDKAAWEDLPLELWGQIGKCIESRFDILRFRSICQQWRLHLPCPKRFPLIVPPPPNCVQKYLNHTFLITEVNAYSPSNSKPYRKLFTFEELGNKFRPTVFRPKKTCFGYRMISFMASPKHPLFQLSYFGKAYYLRTVVSRFNPRSRRVEWYLQRYECAQKTVLLSSDAGNVNLSYAKMSDLSVVALMCESSGGWMHGRLALLRLGVPPENRHWRTDFCHRVFEDIASCRGNLCALDGWGRVFLMDCNSLQMTRVCDPSRVSYELKHKQMFEIRGELYLVNIVRIRSKLIIYKLSLRLKQWIQVEEEDIGWQVLGAIPFLLYER